jgi:hypothetical protein
MEAPLHLGVQALALLDEHHYVQGELGSRPLKITPPLAEGSDDENEIRTAPDF